MSRWGLAVLLGSFVAGVAYWRRALTLDGALAALCVGAITFGRGGAPAASALLTFFVSSSVLSRVGERSKKHTQAKGAQRDAWQVLANGGVATLSIALEWPASFVGALAAAGADTWATELGMLSKATPRMITTLREVPAGTSGGVTQHGLLASLGGALAVGVGWVLAGGSRAGLRVAVVGGVGGALIDSVLGATLQARYTCLRCGALIETEEHQVCGAIAQLTHGLPFITNDVVNALATLSGALIAHRVHPLKGSAPSGASGGQRALRPFEIPALVRGICGAAAL